MFRNFAKNSFKFDVALKHAQDEGEQDVSAQDVSATRWRRTFRQQKVAETSSTPCDSEVVAETSRNVS